MLADERVRQCAREELVGVELLELGHLDMAHVALLQEGLLAGQDLLEEVHRDVVPGGQQELPLVAEDLEEVPLALAVLGQLVRHHSLDCLRWLLRWTQVAHLGLGLEVELADEVLLRRRRLVPNRVGHAGLRRHLLVAVDVHSLN